jgi:hypothetical protein
MSKYIHNKSTASVSLIDGKILIPVGGKFEASDSDILNEDVVYAKRNNWITIEGEESATAAPDAPAGVSFKEDEIKGSLTIPTVAPAEAIAVNAPIGVEATEEKPKAKKAAKVTAEVTEVAPETPAA